MIFVPYVICVKHSVLIVKVLALEGAFSVLVNFLRTFVWSSRRHYSQEMLITSTITKSDYSHLHKNVSYLLRDLGAEYPMYLYQHKTRFKFIFLVKHNPNRQCRLADEKIFWSRCLRTFRSNPNFVRDDTKSQKLFRQTDRCLSVVFRIGNVTKTKIPHKIDKTFKYAFSPYVANVTWQLAARIGIYIFAWIIFRFFTK